MQLPGAWDGQLFGAGWSRVLHPRMAILLLGQMQGLGIQPDSILFNSILRLGSAFGDLAAPLHPDSPYSHSLSPFDKQGMAVLGVSDVL